MIKKVIEQNESKKVNDREMAVLREHFPACFKPDGSFDMERFKGQIKEKVDVVHEGYELNFLGKSYAKLLASVDTTTVVQPNMEHNEKLENKNSDNIYISGDNLDGLKHLLKSYSKKVKCIYIDPNYNLGTDDFVYSDKFDFTVQELEEKLSISEAQAQRILDLTKRESASHSAWLMFMYSRLLLARDIMADDALIFISIDDNEQANLKLLCDDVFGEDNFVATLVWQNKTGAGAKSKGVIGLHEYVMLYARSKSDEWDLFCPMSEKTKAMYNKKDEWFDTLGHYATWPLDTTSMDTRENLRYPITHNGEEIWPEKQWLWSRERTEKAQAENKLVFNYNEETKSWNVRFKGYIKDENGEIRKGTPTSLFIGPYTQAGTKDFQQFFPRDYFSFPKPVELIRQLISIQTNTLDEDYYYLDFFSGSATTAQAIMELNAEDNCKRKYIMVQLPEDLQEKYEKASTSEKVKLQKIMEFLTSINRPLTLDQIGIERIIRAAKKIKEEKPDVNIDYGFKHFTLCEPKEKTLDKLMEFNPDVINDESNNMLDEFGSPAVLTTWLVSDGYGLSVESTPIDLGGYTAYHYDKHLYLVDAGLTADHVVRLFEKYDSDGEFNPENIVLFGYSFTSWTVTEMLTQNMKLLNDGEKNLKINIDIRY